MGVMFRLPGTRPLDPTHHPSPRESARACARLSMAWAWPPLLPCPFSCRKLLPVLLWQNREIALPALSCSSSLCSQLSCCCAPLPTNAAVPCSAELVFPRDANVFYGMNSHVNFDFILRKKAELVG